jgi:hypothetical protein
MSGDCPGGVLEESWRCLIKTCIGCCSRGSGDALDMIDQDLNWVLL